MKCRKDTLGILIVLLGIVLWRIIIELLKISSLSSEIQSRIGIGGDILWLIILSYMLVVILLKGKKDTKSG